MVDESTPRVLLEHEDEILSPNMLLHPRKTNHYRSDCRSSTSYAKTAMIT